MEIIFSPSQNKFFPVVLKPNYEKAGVWQVDGVDVAYEVYLEFIANPPEGKVRGVVDGMPAWVDKPAPTHEQLVDQAAAKQKRLITEANEFIGLKQWAGKASLGRLSDDERAQYNTWLDYLDELEAVKPEDAPDIIWPTPPAV
ncbi:tail fiber assembly protein [Kluyvera ascorbata]|uniref:tail fiber assembly protein n=1 Tax=Kluyvera ascorbata TaxID=51288 RepID=UPI002900D1EB|nr:tail fiber assembly protein [Kluyvera ascorbata]MDU1195364.1 tail fiber assembly protein [Kluyvera ascorbata]